MIKLFHDENTYYYYDNDGLKLDIPKTEYHKSGILAVYEIAKKQSTKPPIFSDDGQTITLTHAKIWLVERPGNQLVMQVLEMDERFRAKTGYYKHHNHIRSAEFTDMNFEDVWLRGFRDDEDFKISNCKRDRCDVITSLRDWDANWSGWGTPVYPTIEQCCRAGSIETGGYFEFPTTQDEVEKVMKGTK